MAIPAITISVLRFHVIALDRREMTAPLGGGLTGRSGTIAFIPTDRALCRTDMPQALRIRQIGRGRGDFIDQPRLHIDTDMLFIAVPIFLLALAANPGLWICRHFRQPLIIQLLDLLLSGLISLFPQRGFGNEVGGIHKGEHFTHESGRFEVVAHGGKQLREPSRPNASTDTGEEAIVRGGLRYREPTKPFGGQVFFQIPCQFSIREVFQELEQQTAKQPFDPIAVGSFELTHLRQSFRGIGQIGLKPAVGMRGRSQAVESNQFHLGHARLQGSRGRERDVDGAQYSKKCIQ